MWAFKKRSLSIVLAAAHLFHQQFLAAFAQVEAERLLLLLLARKVGLHRGAGTKADCRVEIAANQMVSQHNGLP
jgi:hypothetical protein